MHVLYEHASDITIISSTHAYMYMHIYQGIHRKFGNFAKTRNFVCLRPIFPDSKDQDTALFATKFPNCVKELNANQ